MKCWMPMLSLFLLSISLNSNAGIGSVTDSVNTPPSITRKKAVIEGQRGTAVEMNDQVRTAAGKVGITFEDDTKVQINENSRLVIDDFVYDPSSSKGGKLAVNVAHGTVRFTSGQIAKKNPQSVAVNTPVATIGVRGTDFTATVDEFGRSTIILLPSCPPDIVKLAGRDIERDCKTGEIIVTTDAGSVILNKPFQATRVDSRDFKPKTPVILKLTEDQINNMLIVSPPQQLREEKKESELQGNGALDINFLEQNHLVNQLDLAQKEVFQSKLDRNYLQQDMLSNLLDQIDAQMAASQKILLEAKLSSSPPKLLPDYTSASKVVVELDEPQVTLCLGDGSNTQCVTTPTKQNSTLIQIQGSIEVKNRVNTGGNTNITLIQR